MILIESIKRAGKNAKNVFLTHPYNTILLLIRIFFDIISCEIRKSIVLFVAGRFINNIDQGFPIQVTRKVGTHNFENALIIFRSVPTA